ncbi:MAG: DUF885 domain-containing protein [Gammaproteobacteria bacterium]
MPELQALIDGYYQAWFRFHPEKAVDLGVEGYAHLLTPCDDDHIGALISLNEKLLASADELDISALSPADRLDVHLVYGGALLELERLAEQDWRRCDPARFLPINAIYQLTVRSVKDLQQALTSRLQAIPGYLREARTFLREAPEQIPALWLESAMTEARVGAAYFRELRQHPQVSEYQLDAELEAAAHAVEDYAAFLERDLGSQAQGDFACGHEYFDMLLRYRHGLSLTADDLHVFGQRLFDTTLAELKAETRRLRGDDDVQALTRQIQAAHPAAAELLAAYQQGMENARAFVMQHQLLNLPREENLNVIETPAFLRHHIPFAAYLQPAPRDPQQQGWYYVTPASSEAALGEHNYASLPHTCVHEAWPGHHCQFVTANLNAVASSLPRLSNPSATLYEGWALYCEQLMQEQGFLQAPESRFVLLKDRLWRALRILLDVELHTRGLELADAARRMQTALGFTYEQAMADLTWYTRAPTVPMGYATGWALINAARERLRQQEAEFDLAGFHDQLLAEGSIALPFVMRTQFGDAFWEDVRQDIFGHS